MQGVYNALVCCLCRHAVLWLHVCISLRNYTCVRAMSSISDAIKYCAKAGDEKDYIKWSSKVSKVDDYGRVSCHPVPHLRIAVCVCASWLCLSVSVFVYVSPGLSLLCFFGGR